MKITRDNYEAFYLDFIEGNLDENQRNAFLAFLALNPDLALENDLPVLDAPQATLPGEARRALYRTDLDKDPVEVRNVHDFMLADFDGLIGPSKAAELERFIRDHPHFERERLEIARLKLIPDTAQVYRHRAGLKKGQVRYLRPILSASAVAASLVLVFLVTRQGPADFSAQRRAFARSEHHFPGAAHRYTSPGTKPTPDDSGRTGRSLTAAMNVPVKSNDPENRGTHATGRRPVPELPGISLTSISHTLQKASPDPAERYTMIPEQPVNEPRDYALLNLSEMTNPIKPITEKVSGLIHEEVDFRATKTRSDNKRPGFYLKIGKFEIFHKK